MGVDAGADVFFSLEKIESVGGGESLCSMVVLSPQLICFALTK